MRRREFIGGLSVAGMASPLAARAQQPTLPVIGFLHSASPAGYAEFVTAFQQGLAEIGFVEGRNVATEYRWADGAYDRLPALAAELARLQPTVIFANNPGALHVKAATTTIPIVFTAGFDPIELGLVTNLKQPGGNITGVSILNVELGPKRLEFLHELVLGAVMALLVNPTNPNVPSGNERGTGGSAKTRVATACFTGKHGRPAHGHLCKVARAAVQRAADRHRSVFQYAKPPACRAGSPPRHAAIYQYRDFVAA